MSAASTQTAKRYNFLMLVTVYLPTLNILVKWSNKQSLKNVSLMALHNSRQIARIENRFIFNAQYKLSPREQKLILYLIANMDPQKQERFHEQTVTVREFEKMLKADSKKWGGLYTELRDITKRIRSKGIEFDTNIRVDGHRFPGYINWFQSVTPMENNEGEVCIKFLFSEDLKPYLINLNQYARINYTEAAMLKSGFAIRMFQIFKAHRGKMREHEQVSELVYELNNLKKLLGIADKYPDFRNFRRRVLNIIEREMNEHTTIDLEKIGTIRNSKRQIVKLIFIFSDKVDLANKPKDYVPSTEELNTLTFAQMKAYKILVKFKVNEGIAFKQLLPKVKNKEFIGFEDWYFEEVLKIFKIKSKRGVGVFVNWFLEHKIFEQGNHFATTMEKIQARKKKLQLNEPETWDNRIAAKTMTAKAFAKWFRNKNIELAKGN